uniref:Uncharacterized protein n=1 Tax=Anguilla anguilla TaxID=7936 RepID=A0A0E9SJA6_ANGAN
MQTCFIFVNCKAQPTNVYFSCLYLAKYIHWVKFSNVIFLFYFFFNLLKKHFLFFSRKNFSFHIRL